MPRNMSFALTTEQIRNQTKKVTRRNGWRFLKNGDIVNACVKCMGLKPGETIERLGQIRIVDLRIEPLSDIAKYPNDCELEGFPEMTPAEFVRMFCDHMGGDEKQEVTRIQFEYVADRPYSDEH